MASADPPDPPHTALAERFQSRVGILVARMVVCMALLFGVYLQNPVVGLMGVLALRLYVRFNPISASATIGKYALQAAIVLLGFSLGADRLLAVSAEWGWVVAVYVGLTLMCGWCLGRWLRGEPRQQQLLAAGTAICGGTAIATLAPIVRADSRQLATATALVFLLNVVALVTFPAIGHALGLSQEQFGAWVALAIHDTSSVVATAALYGEQAAEVATTVKLGRTLWLIPLVLMFSIGYRRGRAKLPVPVFVLFFVMAAIVGPLLPIGSDVLSWLGWGSKSLLVLALTMIGLEIDRDTLRQLTSRTLLYGIGLWLVVAPLALCLVLMHGDITI